MASYRELIKGYWANAEEVKQLNTGDRLVRFAHALDVTDLVHWLKAAMIPYSKYGDYKIVIRKCAAIDTVIIPDEVPPLEDNYIEPNPDCYGNGPQSKIVYGEESKEYNNLYAKYSHTGCPGVQYEDNCAAPWECASEGGCRIVKEHRGNHGNHYS